MLRFSTETQESTEGGAEKKARTSAGGAARGGCSALCRVGGRPRTRRITFLCTTQPASQLLLKLSLFITPCRNVSDVRRSPCPLSVVHQIALG